MNRAGCANSAGPAGCNLTGFGSSSVAAGNLVLCFSQAPPNVPGIFFCGTTRISFPFGDGIRCCGGQIRRIQLVFSDAAGAGCSTVNIPAATGAVPGATNCYQYWYRDVPGPCGSGFNLSNAYKVVWTP